MKILDVPFVANTDDDMHCFEASLLMILRYFEPESNFDFAKIDQITDKKPSMNTWPQRAMLWLVDRGYKVKEITLTSYEEFIKRGIGYMEEVFGKEAAVWIEKYSDIEKEMKVSRDYIERVEVIYREPTIADLKSCIDRGVMTQTIVNSKKLNGKEGYVGHSVLVTGYDEEGLIIHDPGLPPMESRRVSEELFESAWAYPDKRAKYVLMITRD